MSNQKNEQGFRDIVTNEEFKVLYDTLKRAKLPFSTEHNAMYGLDDVVLVLLHIATLEKICNRFWILENVRFTVNVDTRILQKV